MRWPLDVITITQGFHGVTPSQPWEHWGNDLAANTRTPIKAPESGIAIDVYSTWKKDGYYFGGNYVKVKADSGYSYYMGHMDSTAVTEGQRVSEGQTIGYVGETGQATGPHVHFEMYNNAGTAIDANNYIKEEKYMLNAEGVTLAYQFMVFRNPNQKELEAGIGKTWFDLETAIDQTKERKDIVGKIKDYDHLAKTAEAQINDLQGQVNRLSKGFKKLDEDVYVESKV